jgi:Two component regulator propeller.
MGWRKRRLIPVRRKNGAVTWQKFPLNDAEPEKNDYVRAMFESPDKSFWIGCDTGVYHRRADGRTIFYPIRRVSSYDQIFDIKPSAGNLIWIAHTRGVFLLNPPQDETPGSQFETRRLPELSANVATRNFNVPDVAPGTILRLDLTGATARGSKSPNITSVNSIFKTSDGEFWFAANGFIFRASGERIERLTDDPVLPSAVAHITEDSEGNLWFGAVSGAYKLTKQGLTSFGIEDGLADVQIHSIYQNASGEIFVVSGRWFVNRFRENRFTAEHLSLPDGSTFLWTSQTAFLDENDWWALTTEGLYRFDRAAPQKPAAVYRQIGNLKNVSVYRAFKDKQGNLWFSTRGITPDKNGLIRFDPTSGIFQTFSESDGFPAQKAAASFAQTANGDLWFGFYDSGLMRFRNGRFTDFQMPKACRKAEFSLFTRTRETVCGSLRVKAARR